MTTNMKPDFEDFLKAKHMEERPAVLDDDLPEDFEYWLGGFGAEDWVRLANEYADIWAEAVLFKMSPKA